MLPRIYIIPNSSPTKQGDESECKKTKLSLQQKGRVIAAIKKHPVIWDRNHPSRCQRTILKAAWESVAKETKFDGK